MEPSNVPIIRQASRDDAALLRELSTTTFKATFAEHNTPDDMEAYLRDSFSFEKLTDELSDPQATFFIAELSGKAVGYAKLLEGEPDACVTGEKPIELVRLYVLPDSIGHGLGASLMRHCIETATQNGYQTLWLGVWEHNPRAIAFYHRWGFEEVGNHVFRLGNDIQNDLIFQKSL